MQTKSKNIMSANIRVGSDGMDCEALHRLASSHPEQFVARMKDLIDKGELRWDKVRSLPRMFNALTDVKVPARFVVAGQERAVQASAFPLLTGALTIAGLNDAYENLPTIGQELVTETRDSKKVSEYAAVSALDVNVDSVPEGKDFPEIGATEEKYEIRSKRNGRLLRITAETIEENNVGSIVDQINALADISSDYVEEQTLRRISDIDGSGTSPAEPYVLRPNGAGTSLYSASANTPGVRAPSGTRIQNNALADETDLNNALTVLAAMKNSRNKRLSNPVNQMILLVPFALNATAFKILGSEMVPGVANEINAWGPRGQNRPRLLSSPKLDDLSTSAWYLGNPKRQFKRKWKLDFEYVTLGDSTESFLKSRIAFQSRIAWDCEIGATDYVYFVQSIAATTAP